MYTVNIIITKNLVKNNVTKRISAIFVFLKLKLLILAIFNLKTILFVLLQLKIMNIAILQLQIISITR